MKTKVVTLFCWTFLFLQGVAQVRSAMRPELAPFYHGVASGDPLSDRVIIWTRITLDSAQYEVQVTYEMATDTSFLNVVATGAATTNLDKDYTVKADVTGLQPDTWYYYRFHHGASYSLTGRTRTLPVGSVNNIRLGVVSCSDYQNGYFNAYRHLAERNDVDVILHLGDYIYEYEASTELPGSAHQPEYEVITLTDYRIRHSLYKLDSDLMRLHQQYPFIVVWDDHETANNSWMNGAENHDPGTEGDWETRKRMGVQAYIEWLPIRQPDEMDSLRIWRNFSFGNLADLYMLDTRLYGREEQTTLLNVQELNDPNRQMLGQEQFSWLKNRMKNSPARWQILGQQVMMAPLELVSIPVNLDQWDGYPKQRDSLYEFVQTQNIRNMVVLTGDIHTSWANDLPLTGYNPFNGNNSTGVEFVTTSVTSEGFPFNVGSAAIRLVNPHMKYINLSNHGYTLVDITPARTQGEYYNVSSIVSQNFAIDLEAVWFTQDATKHLQEGTVPSFPENLYPAPAPTAVSQPNLSVQKVENSLLLSAYPNPFLSQVVIQYHSYAPEKMVLQVLDATGNMVYAENLPESEEGVNHVHFDGSGLLSGMYFIYLRNAQGESSVRMLKVD